MTAVARTANPSAPAGSAGTGAATDAAGDATPGATISINGRFLGRQATGVDRFAHEVVKALDEMIGSGDPATAGLTVRLLVPASVRVEPARFAHLQVRSVPGGAGQRWEQISLPRAARGTLLLNLCNVGPLLFRNQVTVLHDAAPVRVPLAYTTAFRTWYRVMAPWIGRIARRVLTVSEFSRHELSQAYRIPAAKIGVLPMSGDHMLHPCADDDPAGGIDGGSPAFVAEGNALRARFGLSHRPYVLAVSSASSHKNFRLVVLALDMQLPADYDVVIAGGAMPVFRATSQMLPDTVKRVGYVSDVDLRALFRHAGCFVFPSLYEGYGLPPVEAMTLGCPVIAAGLPSVREACGDAALYISPTDAAGLRTAITRVMTDAGLRAALRERGLRQVQPYSWHTTAATVLREISPWLAR